jgi:hypothetical protein
MNHTPFVQISIAFFFVVYLYCPFICFVLFCFV